MVEWSNTTRCKRVAFGLRGFESLSAHKMKFNFDKKEPIGQGGERKVFQHPNDSQKVIGVYENHVTPATPNRVKGRYYLTKILHLLFPDNIPDVYTTAPSGHIAEKKERDVDHLNIQRFISLSEKHNKGEFVSNEDLNLAQRKHATGYRNLAYNPKIIDLKRKLGEIGINFDRANCNVTTDSKGHAIYIEVFEPWSGIYPASRSKSLLDFYLSYDEDKLQDVINRLPEPHRSVAQKYFDRLTFYKNKELRQLKNM